jgi:hypothetical protein
MWTKYNASLTALIYNLCVFIIPLYYGITAALYSFSSPYVIQDDARIHIVWLEKFIDPNISPGIYYQTIFQTLMEL